MSDRDDAGSDPRVFKAWREGYFEEPFFFEEPYEVEGEQFARLVCWPGDHHRLEEITLSLLEQWPSELEILYLLHRSPYEEGEDPEWERYWGEVDGAELPDLLRKYHTCAFKDGGAQLCVRIAGSGTYFAVDEHGCLFLYADPAVARSFLVGLGVEERRGPLVYDEPHWHIEFPGDTGERSRFIAALGLEPVDGE